MAKSKLRIAIVRRTGTPWAESFFPFGKIALLAAASAGLLLSLSGCDQLPGKPKESDRWQPPEAEKDFKVLFAANCRACHSSANTVGPSISMHDGLYVAVIPPETLRQVIAEGVKSSLMPGFSQKQGGDLTDEQIDILVKGIEDWGKSQNVNRESLPPYAASPGDVSQGANVYNQYCASCHGQAGTGGKSGSIVNPDYLHLVSEQYLRSVVIAGRAELGMPNYQYMVPGKPMSNEDIANVVAWLSSHRQPNQEPTPTATPTPQ